MDIASLLSKYWYVYVILIFLDDFMIKMNRNLFKKIEVKKNDKIHHKKKN